MYGTVARVRVKPGMMQQLVDVVRDFEARQVPGFVGEYIYQLDTDPNVVMIASVFENRDKYFANANTAEQHALYLRMMEAVEGEPEWHDGEIIYAVVAEAGQKR